MLYIETLPFPEAYRAALAEGPAAAADLPADTPEALFARGLTRLYLGRDDEGAADLSQCGLPAAELELAFVELRRRADLPTLLKRVEALAGAAPPDSLLAARAHHLAGLIENQLRRLQPAADRLLLAAELYERQACRHGAAQVNDSLGMVLASRGRADLAALHFALSLSDKALLGDKEGLAITLGNLGRLALQQGRYRDAIAFFRRDIALLQELANARAEARLQNDLGRACAGLEQHDEALAALCHARELADQRGFLDIWLGTLAEMARVHLAQGQLEEASALLDQAKARLPEQGFTLERHLLSGVEGQLLVLRGQAAGLALLERAVQGFMQARLPDLEVALRMTLADCYVAQGLAKSAENCLYEAMTLAKSEGLVRYVRPITEALARLDLKESAIEEAPRPIAERVSEAGSGYVLRERLGAGAFGTVFRAFDMEQGREVALKRLHLSALYDAGERQRLIASAKAELEAAATIRHPGIVRVYAVGVEQNGDFYVVQELIKGEGLAKIMRRPGDKGPAEVVPYLLRIAHALEALHRAGVVHRDLKPGNVIVKNGWQPVLVDFGIAHVPSRAEVAKENLGTLEYTAPEQAEGEPADARADLYAFGVIAYEWFVGRRPLEIPDDFREALRVLRRQDPVPLRRERPDLPRELADLVDDLLEKKPRRRPATAALVADRLAPFAG